MWVEAQPRPISHEATASVAVATMQVAFELLPLSHWILVTAVVLPGSQLMSYVNTDCDHNVSLNMSVCACLQSYQINHLLSSTQHKKYCYLIPQQKKMNPP